MARPAETDPGQGSLFDVVPVVSRQTTAPGDDTGTKRKAPRRKTAAELAGTVVWRAYGGKTRVQCSDCVLAARERWEDGHKPLERSIGGARWIEITYVGIFRFDKVAPVGATEQHTYLCSHHASERGHTNVKKGRS